MVMPLVGSPRLYGGPSISSSLLAALKQMVLAALAPVAVGFILGPQALINTKPLLLVIPLKIHLVLVLRS